MPTPALRLKYRTTPSLIKKSLIKELIKNTTNIRIHSTWTIIVTYLYIYNACSIWKMIGEIVLERICPWNISGGENVLVHREMIGYQSNSSGLDLCSASSKNEMVETVNRREASMEKDALDSGP